MRSTIIILSLLLIILATGCQKGTTIDGQQRSEGEIKFRSNCQSCHILPKPSLKTDEEWPELVNNYGGKIKLSEADVNLIIGYLQAHN